MLSANAARRNARPAARNVAHATHAPLATPTLDLTRFAVGHGAAPKLAGEHAPAVARPATCTRAVPCDQVDHKYPDNRCKPCFARWLAEFDAASEARTVAVMDMGLDGTQFIDGEEHLWFTPSEDDLAEWRASQGDEGHDGLLSPEEEALILHGLGDREWAEEHLDPEEDMDLAMAAMIEELEEKREAEGW